MFKKLFILLALTYSSVSLSAQTFMLMPIDSVYDGDTINTHVSEAKLPPPLNKLSVRLLGIDTPEKGGRAKCEKEAKLAEDAKVFLLKLIGDSKTMKLENFSWDKYGGRIDSRITINGLDISQQMIDNGLAVPYNGGTKVKNWCE